MTPTKELRDKLDERGIAYETSEDDTTIFYDVDGNRYTYNVNPESGWAQLYGYNLTPEQAIAATVGAGTLTAEQVRECLKGVYFEGYSDGATHRVNGIEETDWQAIADELNAVAGTGTCRNISKVTDARKRKVRFVCSECDAWIDSEFIWNHEYSNGESPWVKDCKLNYCPNCGRRIVEEEAE